MTAAGDAANIAEVPPIVVVNGRQPRIIGRYRVAEEHFHAGPAVRGAPVAAEGGSHVAEQLADARRLHPQTGANHSQARRPTLKNGPRTIGPDHLIISQVDQEKVRLMGRAVAGDLQGPVGVDRRHRRIDDLELPVRILLAEHDGEDPAEAERRVGKALGRRPPQDKDANGAGGLGGEGAGIRLRGKPPGEETPSEAVIDGATAAGIRAEEERGRVAVSSQPQAGLQEAQAENRRED